ncbi:MAG: prepilin-type N-terminal cleavage/methylation domain-containing protein [Candidatus Gracilibacteria bacterium]|nr:prepilin-type N-terminal cleavage/methylation domain-containing protein [Candidatus Gracilibacteria bacterium]MDD2909029.1 prepilin-type N-terminal cleavage/methylation domain-containing protein [Candidatus Gracilibacteria bacterium]
MKTKNNQPKTTIGFTLVELIVVIVILAILSTIAFLSFNSYSSSSRDTVRLTDVANSKKALELYITKASKYPIPDEVELYVGNTGSVISQGVLGDNVARNIGLSKVVIDPLTQGKYTYSTFGNGLYYQIASSLENNDGLVGFNDLDRMYGNGLFVDDLFVQRANAVDSSTSTSFKTTRVEGNYKMDPSLPSLIVVPSSVNTNSGIFDPSVCFVVDGGVNTSNSGLVVNTVTSSSGSCAKKKDMNLKDFDSSLVGYWDMETTFNSGGKIWIKDNSGYGNDVFGSGITIKYETGGIINNAIEFNGEGLSQTGYYESEKMMGNIFNDSLTMSVIFRKNNAFETKYQKLILIGTGSTKNNFLVGISQGDINYNFYGIIWPESYTGALYTRVFTKYPNPNQRNLASLSYNKGELKFFLNGNLIGKSNYTASGTFLEKKNLPLRIGYGYNIEYFKGIIDDVKIYNRALSDSEIYQQAKIAGF